eukprot:7195342-Ditylum_brightwellii.AAC.1
MQEKLSTMNGFDTILDQENIVNLLKAIKSTVFKYNNKCDVYVAMENIVGQFWRFCQARDMANLDYLEKFKNLVAVAEEHGANIWLHLRLLNQEVVDVNSLIDDEKEVMKGIFQMHAHTQGMSI